LSKSNLICLLFLGKRAAVENETEDGEDEVKRKKKKEEGGKVVSNVARLAAVRSANGAKAQLANKPQHATLLTRSSTSSTDRRSPTSPKGGVSSPSTPKGDNDDSDGLRVGIIPTNNNQ